MQEKLAQTMRILEAPDIDRSPRVIVTVTTTYSVSQAITLVLADATVAPFTVTLPDATSTASYDRYITVKRTSAANNVTVGGGGSNIDGAATYVLTAQYKFVTVVSNGTQWLIVSFG